MRLAHVTKLRVPSEALRQTGKVLQTYGERGYEGLVLWAGTISGARAEVLRMIVPEQNPIKNESGVGYFVEQKALLELSQFLAKEQLRLLAQIHSHPTEAYHSETDDRYAIVTEDGGFSLVVPDFARRPMTLNECAIYRLMRANWVELMPAIVRDVFEIG